MNVAVWVERHGRGRPDEAALADGERVHASWGAFAARTAAVAAGLRDGFGVAPGDRVAIVMRNRPEYLKRYREVGLTMPLLWPPFQDVPVAKTLDDLKRLKEEIMPQVDGM